MTFKLNFLPIHRSKQVLQSVWWRSCCCWPGSVTEGGLSASKAWLRRFLLLKLVTVLLFPHGTHLPLLVGCTFSLQALFLLLSPRVSTKPSTVLLGHLALADGLVLLSWTLRLGATLSWWMANKEAEEGGSAWWREAVSVLCQQLLDTHHLASLLLLGLLGLEATLVLRWPQQTRRFRTAHWARLGCSLIWILVLFELLFLLQSKLLQDSGAHIYSSTPQTSQTFSLGLVPHTSLPVFSSWLRRTLWLLNSWLHYVFLNNKPQKRQSSFH